MAALVGGALAGLRTGEHSAPGGHMTMSLDHGKLAGMDTVSISAFKATCLARLHQVKRTGRPLLVTRKGEPVAEIRPPAPAKPSGTWLGSLADSGRIVGDVVAPAAAPDEWEVLR